ncbi:uncharacterized protein [Lolium perenne]|uniref:uncharacterized protein isoform X1 n=1 Tax=Lolium perenne TaxID=4522 RepID=UPI003A990FEA
MRGRRISSKAEVAQGRASHAEAGFGFSTASTTGSHPNMDVVQASAPRGMEEHHPDTISSTLVSWMRASPLGEEQVGLDLEVEGHGVGECGVLVPGESRMAAHEQYRGAQEERGGGRRWRTGYTTKQGLYPHPDIGIQKMCCVEANLGLPTRPPTALAIPVRAGHFLLTQMADINSTISKASLTMLVLRG